MARTGAKARFCFMGVIGRSNYAEYDVHVKSVYDGHAPRYLKCKKMILLHGRR